MSGPTWCDSYQELVLMMETIHRVSSMIKQAISITTLLKMNLTKRRSTYCRPTRTCIGHDSSLLPIMKWINKGDGLWDLTCLRNCKQWKSCQRMIKMIGNPSLSLIALPNKTAHYQLRGSSCQRMPLKNGLWDVNDWELHSKSVQKFAYRWRLLTMTTR